MSKYFIVIRTELPSRRFEVNTMIISEYNNMEESFWASDFDDSPDLDVAIKKILIVRARSPNPDIAYFENKEQAREAAITIKISDDPEFVRGFKSVEYYIVKQVDREFIKTKI